ncbi:acetate kinase [Leucogyrophana mollusca]|uniref:Acetate kinase n=1 Tax=Leucogyrophana mollusca TaxID=85980 RepID=A0ACB8BSM8_9AGAM|nr:acetate kinase [Leucogyrophana mollusca]
MSLILSVNAGSSSLKVSLFRCSPNDSSEPILLLSSSTSSISTPPAKFSFTPAAVDVRPVKDEVESIHNHASAFKHFLDRLKGEASIERTEIKHVCHRIVHGGDYTDPVVIANESLYHIEKLADLAPLHNGSALSVIKTSIDALPHARSIAFFDTAFHKALPRQVSTYAINQQVARDRGLKKYGFHGLSYSFILRSVACHLEKDPRSLNMIAMHIGSGASICAIRSGESIDTSMGLTPLSGLPGATRAGDVDASLIFHYTSRSPAHMSHDPSLAQEVHITEAEDILNTKSGWKALTGTTDFGEITKNADISSPPSASSNSCTVAFHLLLDRILHYVGAYYLALRGDVDALVFAGGVGEKSEQLRSAIGEAVGCLGFAAVDEGRNRKVSTGDEVVADVGREGGGKRLLVCKTDEQFEMTRECVSLAHRGSWE